ncbi:putative disease resistance RPP13-like protein 1-like [Capsicum annuum]|nr:putative disease resistance RPP13-like protein 1-like [Capsicum annuum]
MEIGLAVGGAVGGAFLNVLFDRLARRVELLKMFHDDGLLENLGNILLGLQIVLSDAENKQASDQLVRQWLNKLQSAVDSAENLMEQVNYEALKLKVEGQHQNLAETCNQQKYFDLGKKLETRTPSTSVVESDVFGRKNEIERLIDHLMSKEASEKNMTVVPIVGMGGMGKTTLAKAAYNDEKVKNHFNLKAWFCVSEPYDAFRITKGLLQDMGSFDLNDDNNLNRLQVKLKEKLNGKRFLIVLDDVWNDNYNEWDDLRNIFVHGDIGSKIIVTTRKESVTLMMSSGAINVGTLSDEAS